MILDSSKWTNEVWEIVSFGLFHESGTGKKEPMDAINEKFNQHGNSKDFDFEGKNIDVNIAAYEYSKHIFSKFQMSLYQVIQKEKKVNQFKLSPFQENLVKNISTIFQSYHEIIIDKSLDLCNFLGENVKSIDTSIIKKIENGIEIVKSSIEKRKDLRTQLKQKIQVIQDEKELEELKKIKMK